jgi:T5SS/PEP-CTERM-associated repeat protein/autotransporter-associated beta strand protein
VATVTGSGSQWNNSSSLYVGNSGTGTLNVEAGGVVSNTVGYISTSAGSTGVATVTGSGSRWNNSSYLSVGFYGTGTLNVEAGGVVNNTVGIIGTASNSTGVATVTGSGSLWNNSSYLYVGESGTGTLNVEAGGVVAAASGITIASQAGSSGTLNIGRFGTNDTGGTIIAPTIAFGAGTGAINFNQSDAVTITSAISGAGTLNQLGAGTTTLSGANSYTGVTIVSAGTLFFSRTTALPTNTAAALVAGSGATLAFAAGGAGEFNASQISALLANLTSATNNNNGLLAGSSFGLSVDSAWTLTNPVVDSAGTGGGAIGLLKLGAGTLTLSGTNSYTGVTTVSAGTLFFSRTTALPTNTAAALVAGSGATLAFAAGGAGEFDASQISDLLANLTSATNNNNGLLAGSRFGLSVDGALTLTNPVVDSSGIGGGAIGLTKLGTGTLTLSGANTYSGGILVGSGELVGDTRSLRGAITNNAQVTFFQKNHGLYAGAMSGSGLLAKTGAGTLTLLGANSYSGGTLVSGGELVGDTSSLQGSVTNDARVKFSQATNGTYAGAMSGSGLLTKLGAGTLTLAGTNTYSGDTTISAGVLRLANENAAGSGRIIQTALDSLVEFLGGGRMTNDMTVFQYSFANSLEAAGQVTLADTASSIAVFADQAVTGSGSFVGAGGLTKLGAGTLALTAGNSFSGPLSVVAGTLQLDSVSGAAAGSVTSVSVGSGATLLVSQSNQVNSGASVTLSGGTIRTASGVSEVFGNLSVTGSGLLDFGTTSYANANTISFGTYTTTPSALLTINNFNFGSTMTFGSNLSSDDLATFSFTNGGIASSSWDEGAGTFTITAIPEPSTYVAAIGLLALMLWPLRRWLRGKVS